MAVPTKFPAMLQRGSDVAKVDDLNSYIGAAAQGFVFPTSSAAGKPVTPSVVISSSGSLTTTIKQVKLSNEQDDGR